jgi:uncharacterized membrane protein YphA (DoxX/SURF4 family)
MLAGMFIYGGIDAVRNPESKEPKAERVAPAIAEPLGLPPDTVDLIRWNGIAQIAAGGLLAIGRLPRLSAAVLACSLVPTTLAGHRFWEETDKQARASQQIHFLKNLAMLGGLILAATDTEGRPSLSWKAKRAARRTADRAKDILPIGD